MTFSCGNHDFDTDICKRLHNRCIMGRPGCVLEGKVKLSYELLETLKELEDAAMPEKRRRRGKKR